MGKGKGKGEDKGQGQEEPSEGHRIKQIKRRPKSEFQVFKFLVRFRGWFFGKLGSKKAIGNHGHDAMTYKPGPRGS
jgi:hypothetical protein